MPWTLKKMNRELRKKKNGIFPVKFLMFVLISKSAAFQRAK